jgi:hypothetical protein
MTKESIDTQKAVLYFNLHHKHGWFWRKRIKYEDVKNVLHLFNINPRHIHKSFPYHGRRKGRPIVDLQDLIELWDDAESGGEYIMLLQLKLKEYLEKIDYYHTGVIIEKGSRIWLFNYEEGNGASCITLRKTLKITKERVDYSIGEDHKVRVYDIEGVYHYGIEDVYHVASTVWNNQIKPFETTNPDF